MKLEREYSMAKVLVVGGAGYLGGHITDRLLEEGHDVRVYDMMLFEDQYLKPVDFVFGDIRDHDRGVDNRGDSDPFASPGVGVYGDDVEGTEEECVDPDGLAPPHGPRHEQGIVIGAEPVREVHDGPRRPNGVFEIGRVDDNELFDIEYVGDKDDVQPIEGEDGDIAFTL